MKEPSRSTIPDTPFLGLSVSLLYEEPGGGQLPPP
jgi:hypothetical protein